MSALGEPQADDELREAATAVYNQWVAWIWAQPNWRELRDTELAWQMQRLGFALGLEPPRPGGLPARL